MMIDNEKIQEIYNSYPKLKNYDLAVVYLFNSYDEKPYYFTKDLNICYLQEFKAKDKNNKVISHVMTTSIQLAKEILHDELKAKKDKYTRWLEADFSIQYAPLRHGQYEYIKYLFQQYYPNIKDFNAYFENILLEFEKINPTKRKGKYLMFI